VPNSNLQTTSESAGFRTVWPALSLALASGLFLLALGLKMPRAEETVALVFDPAVTPAAVLERLAAIDGRLVGIGGADNIVIVRFDHDVSLGQLWHQGIWFGLDPVFLSGCFKSFSIAANGNVS
jgi:hypothetical protein